MSASRLESSYSELESAPASAQLSKLLEDTYSASGTLRSDESAQLTPLSETILKKITGVIQVKFGLNFHPDDPEANIAPHYAPSEKTIYMLPLAHFRDDEAVIHSLVHEFAHHLYRVLFPVENRIADDLFMVANLIGSDVLGFNIVRATQEMIADAAAFMVCRELLPDMKVDVFAEYQQYYSKQQHTHKNEVHMAAIKIAEHMLRLFNVEY